MREDFSPRQCALCLCLLLVLIEGVRSFDPPVNYTLVQSLYPCNYSAFDDLEALNSKFRQCVTTASFSAPPACAAANISPGRACVCVSCIAEFWAASRAYGAMVRSGDCMVQ